jgi:DNA-binding NtrC family response regulator
MILFDEQGGGMKRILVVDDEMSLAFFLRESIADLCPEYQVEMAYSGEKAIGRIVAEPFDLIVTDLCMPGVSGLEIIRRLRQTNPQARVILITAYGNDKTKAEAHRLGTFRYLNKPFDMRDFARAVQEALFPTEESGVG